MKANEIKRSTVFKIDGKNIIVKKVFVQSPSSRSGNTLYKVIGSEIGTQQKFERSFKDDEVIDNIDMTRHAIQLLFRDADGCTFMDTESYEQYVLPVDSLDEELPFLTDGLEGLRALVVEGQILGIELHATLTTGLIAQIPEYLSIGEKIKVNTETREFMSRA